MPSPFKSNIVLKVGGVEITIKSLLDPKWQFLGANLSIGSGLLGECAGIVNTLWWPILLLAVAKRTFLHQVLEG